MKKLTFVMIIIVGVVAMVLCNNFEIAHEEKVVTRDELVEFYRVVIHESEYDELVVYEEEDDWIRAYGYKDGKLAGACGFDKSYYEGRYLRYINE